MVNIYVGNLSYEATEDDIRAAFEAHGEVSSVKVIMDRLTGKSRGFAFVEMPNNDEGMAAIGAVNGTDLAGRALTVSQARPKQDGGGGGRGRY